MSMEAVGQRRQRSKIKLLLSLRMQSQLRHYRHLKSQELCSQNLQLNLLKENPRNRNENQKALGALTRKKRPKRLIRLQRWQSFLRKCHSTQIARNYKNNKENLNMNHWRYKRKRASISVEAQT